jgi:hypothetical protein
MGPATLRLVFRGSPEPVAAPAAAVLTSGGIGNGGISPRRSGLIPTVLNPPKALLRLALAAKREHCSNLPRERPVRRHYPRFNLHILRFLIHLLDYPVHHGYHARSVQDDDGIRACVGEEVAARRKESLQRHYQIFRLRVIQGARHGHRPHVIRLRFGQFAVVLGFLPQSVLRRDSRKKSPRSTSFRSTEIGSPEYVCPCGAGFKSIAAGRALFTGAEAAVSNSTPRSGGFALVAPCLTGMPAVAGEVGVPDCPALPTDFPATPALLPYPAVPTVPRSTTTRMMRLSTRSIHHIPARQSVCQVRTSRARRIRIICLNGKFSPARKWAVQGR